MSMVTPNLTHEGRASELCCAPLTIQQKFYWGIYQENNEWQLCDTIALLITGPLSMEVLRRSVDEILARHDALRSRVITDRGYRQQYFGDTRSCGLKLEPIDLSAEEGDKNELARRLVEEIARRPCNLSIGPLFEVHVLKLSDHKHVFLWKIHHIIFDVHSMNLISREFWQLYADARVGRPSKLQRVTTQYSEYAEGQEAAISVWKDSHQPSWNVRLVNAVPIQWPRDEGGVQTDRPDIDYIRFSLGTALSTKLRELARQRSTLLSLELLTVFTAAVSRSCGQLEFVVTPMVAGRGYPEHRYMVGLLSHPVYLPVNMVGNESFVDLLSQINREFYRAILSNDCGATVMENPGLHANTLYTWLPWTWEEAWGRPTAAESEKLDITVERFQYDHPQVFPKNVNVELYCLNTEDVRCLLVYRPRRVSTKAIRRFAKEFQELCERFVEEPHGRIS